MSSKGTKTFAVRLDERFMMEVRVTIARRNLWSRRKPWDFSEFVREALEEKIRKMARSRGQKPGLAKGKKNSGFSPVAIESESARS